MPPSRLGVDFGTSHTVAVLDRDGAAVPLLFDSSPILPSAVYAEPDGRLLVGADAVNAARLEPARFEPNPKRRIDDGHVLLGDKEFGVVDLFAAVLTRVRQECERALGTPPAQVVLTHPAVWGSARRLVLEDAATAAGFVAAQMLPEPVAAARYLSRVLRHDLPEGSGLVVADLGGGTFDASVVAESGSAASVPAVDGIDGLGGVDIDHALVELLGQRYGDRPEWTRIVTPATMEDRRLRRLLYQDVRAAKERLSRHARAELPVPLVGGDTHVTRDELEALTRPLLERAVRVTQAVMRASRLPDERLSDVLLVGGASRMPLVASMLHQALGRPPIVLEQPELAVAQGAALVDEPAADAVPVAAAAAAPVPPPGGDDLAAYRFDRSGMPIGYASEVPLEAPAPATAGFTVGLANVLLRLLRLGGGLWTIFLAVGVVGIGLGRVTPEGSFLVVLLAVGTLFNPAVLRIAAMRLRDGAPGARIFTVILTAATTFVYVVMAATLLITTRQTGPFWAPALAFVLVSAGVTACLWSPAARRWYDGRP